MLAIQQKNLSWAPRTYDSLTLIECKAILHMKQILPTRPDLQKSADLSELKDEVKKCLKNGTEEISPLLGHFNFMQRRAAFMRQQAAMKQQVNSMTPDQLKQQANALRTTDPDTLRKTNPAFRNFSDAQIKLAADQMDQMAANPNTFQNMKNQMSNMSPSAMEKMRNGMANPSSAMPGAAPGRPPMGNPMGNLNPAQLLQQAQQLKMMPKAQLRQMNPAWARMTDAQIDMSIAQMETVAKNPKEMEKMMNQVKSMKKEDIDKIKNMAKSGDMKGLESMNIPDSVNAQAGIGKVKTDSDEGETLTDEQIQQSMEMFDKLDERKSSSSLGMIFIVLIFVAAAAAFFFYGNLPGKKTEQEL